MAGLSATGFVKKTRDEILADMEAAQRTALGAELNQEATSLLGVLNGIVADRAADLWDVAEGVYASFDPDEAGGAALDGLGALTGTRRLAATKSSAALVVTGTATTVLALGRVISVSGNALARFTTKAQVTLAAVTAWAATTAYSVGDRRKNGGNVYQCTVAGTSAGSGGPTGTGAAITDGTVTWTFLGAGDAAADVVADAESTGPTVANARTLTVIETPVTGWDGVINLLDATLGTNTETDAAYRVRRDDNLRAQGAAALEALRSDIRSVTGVTAAFVFENTANEPNADGVPAKAFEAVVLGGADADIRAAIFDSAPTGIQSHGSVSGTVTDDQGFAHTIKFSRPTTKDIWVIVDVTKDAAKFPADGATQIKNAIATNFAATLTVGDDVIQSKMYSYVFGISGVVDVTKIWIGFSNPPTGPANLVIGSRELAAFDTSRIAVNVT